MGCCESTATGSNGELVMQSKNNFNDKSNSTTSNNAMGAMEGVDLNGQFEMFRENYYINSVERYNVKYRENKLDSDKQLI